MKGIYCIITSIKWDANIKIGRLGRIMFKKGTYAYIGSAQNNLEKRVKRHLSAKKKMHWHIDYLLANPASEILKVRIYKNAGKEEECNAAKNLLLKESPVKGFGCSDCSCKSHLFKINNLMSIGNFSSSRGWSAWK